jgi:transposase
MSNKPRKMNKLRTSLQSIKNGLSLKAISKSHGISRNTLKRYIKIIGEHKYKIEDILKQSDSGLEKLFYKTASQGQMRRDLAGREDYYQKELQRPHITCQLLYEEYKDIGGELSRSSFYKELEKLREKEVSYTKERIAADRLEVDYAGKKLKYKTEEGEEKQCELLVCVLPKSNLIYCEAQSSQGQNNYINGLGRALLYIGKMPKEILSDNLKSGINKSDRYEPILTELCEEASKYYGIHITATRVGKPKDKPNVERSVRIIYERIYAKLRDRKLSNLDDLNVAIQELLVELNDRQVNGKPSRRMVYEMEEEPYMLPLAVNQLMEIKKSRMGKVGKNYHIELTEDKTHYSVPYSYVGSEVKMRYSDKIVEIYHKGDRIAIHNRTKSHNKYITEESHMPQSHKAAKELEGHSKESIMALALKVGISTQEVVKKVMERNQYVQQGFKSALGIIYLEKKYGKERLEKASEKMKAYNPTYQSMSDYLMKGMDKVPDRNEIELTNIRIMHHNLRHIKTNKIIN